MPAPKAAQASVANAPAASPTTDKTPQAVATVATPDVLTSPVDLLKLIDLKRDKLSGNWKMDGTSLAKEESPAEGAVQIPFVRRTTTT